MERVFRSVLFVPAVRPDRFSSAVLSGADAVVFDLEDSVDPTKKAAARQQIADTWPRLGATGLVARFIRVNAASSNWFIDDLDFVRSLSGVDAVVVPKAESPEQIAGVASAVGGPHVIPLLETARGILHAPAIAASVGGLRLIFFGAEDLTAELGVPRTVDGDELVYPRAQVVLAAASVGADAIDAVFIDLASPDALKKDALRAKAMGFRGKMAIHPNQIPIINDVFTTSPDDVDKARRIVEAFDEATRRGEAVVRVDDQMVDAPVVARARRVLARATLGRPSI